MVIPVDYVEFVLTFSMYALIKITRHLIAWSFQTPQPHSETGATAAIKTGARPVTAPFTQPQTAVTESSQKTSLDKLQTEPVVLSFR